MRSREAVIMQETQEIYAEINDLRRTLVAHGIDPPAPIIRTNPKQSFKLTIEDYHGGRKICTQPEKDPLARKHEKQPSFETAIPSAPPDHEIKLSDPERRQDPVCPTGKQLPRKYTCSPHWPTSHSCSTPGAKNASHSTGSCKSFKSKQCSCQ